MKFSWNETTLVYLDEESGDRVSFETVAGNNYIVSAKYEFSRYE